MGRLHHRPLRAHPLPTTTWRLGKADACGYLDSKVLALGPQAAAPSLQPHDPNGHLRVDIGRCNLRMRATYLCELESEEGGSNTSQPVTFGNVSSDLPASSFLACPLGHLTYSFLACDVSASCWVATGGGGRQGRRDDVISCGAPLTPLPPRFTCDNGVLHVAYSLVCDVRQDCGDGSDEDFCVRPPCLFDWFPCGNGQVRGGGGRGRGN